jgi:hypothetical protein
MLTNIVINPDVVFFDNDFLNFCMKAMIIVGGAFGLNRAMALVGNLISAGAGSNEMRDAAQQRASFGRALGTALHPITSLGSEMIQQKKRDLAGRALKGIGLGISDHGQRNENGDRDVNSSNDEANKNTNDPKYNSKGDGVSLAIANLGGLATGKNEKKKEEENQNNHKGPSKGAGLVNDSINESINRNNNNNGGEN